jgi:hypothetical protein
LYFYGARWFDASLSRFTSPDTIIRAASQGVQAWDRYAGMNNNPVRYNDPSGHCIGPLLAACIAVGVFIMENAGIISAIALTGAVTAFTTSDTPQPELVNNPAASQAAFESSLFQAGVWLTGGQAALQFGSSVAPQMTEGESTVLPDDTPVCRGGSCKANNFITGAENVNPDDGTLSGVSVNSKPGVSLEELTSVKIPHPKVGITTVGAVRAAGGNVVPNPLPDNPYHALMSGITATTAEDLFTPTVPNPYLVNQSR